MIGRKALFPGRDYLHQLRLIIDVLGTPSEEDLASIANAQAVQFLRTLPIKPKRCAQREIQGRYRGDTGEI